MRPGRTDKPDVGKIVIAIDTSGSIDDVIMNRFISELRRIYSVFQSSKTFATKIILWSDGPYAQSPEFPSNKFNELKNWINTNTKSGGTAINQVVQLINGFPDLNEYIATVWFTDGEIWDLRTPLPDMDNVFVIQGFSSDTSKRFFADVQKYRPRNKKITIVRTDY
jgi:predicted metal-dependent peptidase